MTGACLVASRYLPSIRPVLGTISIQPIAQIFNLLDYLDDFFATGVPASQECTNNLLKLNSPLHRLACMSGVLTGLEGV